MDELIEQLIEFKKEQENGIQDKEEKIVDISYYGKINLSKNDGNLENQKQEELYLVEKEKNGEKYLEFHTNRGTIATIQQDGEIVITNAYNELINTKELLLQLQNIMPLSLEKLEQINARKNENPEKQVNSKSKPNKQAEEIKNKYQENSKDAKIDMNKKITETKTFADLVPEVKEKKIIDVRVRRTDATKFEFIGINQEGEEIKLETLMQTEGTNPKEDIIEINQDGSKVKKEQVLTMLKIHTGENQGREDEGFTVNLGNYGIPEVNYYRRAREEDEYTSIPVNLENTNQKRTELEVRQYMEKKRNTTVNDNIEKANDRIEQNDNEETVLENIDDDPYNDKIVDNSEIMIQKAAKRCKISVESFKKELEKADGDTLEEKIENAEEELNEQFIGRDSKRA